MLKDYSTGLSGIKVKISIFRNVIFDVWEFFFLDQLLIKGGHRGLVKVGWAHGREGEEQRRQPGSTAVPET